MKKLNDYRLNESNPRTITEAKLKKLIKSINELPQMMEVRPIVVDQDGVVLGGNMRYRALLEMGKTEVPDGWIKEISELTEEQKKEFVIKDNVGFGEWDWDILANEWDTEDLSDWGLDLPDFRGGEEDLFADKGIPDDVSEWGVVVILENEEEQMRFHAEMVERGFETKVINT